MDDYVISLDDPAAADANCVGPKAANLAALAQAGLLIPGAWRARCQPAHSGRRAGCGRWRCRHRAMAGLNSVRHPLHLRYPASRQDGLCKIIELDG